MNRIICDICGSEYPETADRCPICSYPRQGTEKAAAATGAAAQEKVKGGRFSDKNVRKRRKAQEKAAGVKNPNRPLLVVIVLLLIAIVLVSAYIALRFLGGSGLFPVAQTTVPTTSVPAGTTTPPTVPCSGIQLETTVVTLDAVGQTQQLQLTLLPGDTTDAVVYESADPDVVTVSESGLLTAVGPGQTAVSVTCGGITEVIDVICWFDVPTTAPVKSTAPAETTKATEPAVLTLDNSDVSFFGQGEAFTLRVSLGDQAISRASVTWASSDPGVATVENGYVTGVAKGTATITAEYQGQKASCIVRCQFKDTTWQASSSDVTLSVGESFRLTVTNGSGETADAIWTMDVDGIVSIDGKTITGHVPGTVTLTTTVDGVTLTCVVRVK